MKAITLTQPWATLVAVGAKRYETRSWPTSYRGPLAIHAAKGLNPIGGEVGLRAFVQSSPFWRALSGGKPLTPANLEAVAAGLPRGAVVATCELGNVHRTEELFLTAEALARGEEQFGDWSPGRFAWWLKDVEALPEPVLVGGQLGLWEWDGQVQAA